MIGIDTNIFLRFYLKDNPDQSARAASLIQSFSAPKLGYISLVTLAELIWVLDRTYRKSRSELSLLIHGLLESKQVTLENRDAVDQALRKFESSNADFSDCLIERLCASAGCTQTMTFDVGAAKSAGMVLL